MITKQTDNQMVDEYFRERIIPFLGTAETQMALQETELIYRALCNKTPAKQYVSLLYQEFLAAYEFITGSGSKQAVLDCIHFLNKEVSKNPALA